MFYDKAFPPFCSMASGSIDCFNYKFYSLFSTSAPLSRNGEAIKKIFKQKAFKLLLGKKSFAKFIMIKYLRKKGLCKKALLSRCILLLGLEENYRTFLKKNFDNRFRVMNESLRKKFFV